MISVQFIIDMLKAGKADKDTITSITNIAIRDRQEVISDYRDEIRIISELREKE